MFAVLPDLDTALVAFLKTHAALTPLHGGRVGMSLSGSLTQIRVANLGGPDTAPWQDTPEFQVECWGGSQTEARDLARTVVAAIDDMRGPITGGTVKAARPTLRPLWQPDANGRPRYIIQLLVQAQS